METVGNKFFIHIAKAKESAKIFEGHELLHPTQAFCEGLVDVERFWSDFMALLLDCGAEPFVSILLERYNCFLQCVEHAVNIVNMGLKVLWEYNIVVDVDEAGLLCKSVKDNI